MLKWIRKMVAVTTSSTNSSIGVNLQDLVGGMGPMTLNSSKPDKVKYEMQHQDGLDTYSFPVIFIKDDNGNWVIKSF